MLSRLKHCSKELLRTRDVTLIASAMVKVEVMQWSSLNNFQNQSILYH